MIIPTYEIFAVKYAGPVSGKLAFVLWNEGWDTDVERNYYLWAVKGNDEILVVDTGCGARLAAKRQLKDFVNPIDLLAKIGANKTNVKKIILTHLHWDHAGGFEMFLQAFPNATLYAQEKEFDFWAKNPIAKRAPFAKVSDERVIEALGCLEGTDRLRTVSGDAAIMSGIQVILAPGHTIGLQAVEVNTSKGTAILASDCLHVRENLVQDTPSCLITDLIAWMESFDKLRSNASSVDLIFPGHDVKMLTDFPKEAEGVTRLV